MDFETKVTDYENYEYEKGGSGGDIGGGKDDTKEKVYLIETFYITSKKNNVFQVKLTSNGLCLHKESSSSGNTKEQLILLKDIIGCRCLRATRKTHGSCTCSSALASPTHSSKVIEENPAIFASSDINEADVSAYLYIYAYIIKKNKRNRTTLTLRFRSFDSYEDNNKEAQKWRIAIKQLIKGDLPPFQISKISDIRKILVLLNPKSGPGKAREVFQKKVIPLFIEAEVGYDLQVTKRRNFAKEFVRLKNIYSWKAIVCVGGDGLFWEVINGIMEREDWEQIFDTIPIGVIPSGSGNGLAKSIAHKFNEPFDTKTSVLGATISALKGRTEKMDLVRIETKSEIMFSFLSCGWGLISDVDIESERLRSIGYQRFTIWSVHRLINLRTYAGKISYIPIKNENLNTLSKVDNNDSATDTDSNTSKSNLKHSLSCNDSMLDFSDCQIIDGIDGEDTTDALYLETSNNNSFIPQRRQRLDSWYSVASKKSAYFSTAESYYQSVHDIRSNMSESFDGDSSNIQARMYGPASNIPALAGPISPISQNGGVGSINNSEWIHEEGQYVMVHAAYQTHIGTDCYFAPSATLNDGIIWLLIIRGGISRSQLLSFMLGMSSGTHINVIKDDKYFQIIPVKAFRIEPLGTLTHGNITVDGESVEYGPVQGEIFPKIVNVLVPDTTIDC